MSLDISGSLFKQPDNFIFIFGHIFSFFSLVLTVLYQIILYDLTVLFWTIYGYIEKVWCVWKTGRADQLCRFSIKCSATFIKSCKSFFCLKSISLMRAKPKCNLGIEIQCNKVGCPRAKSVFLMSLYHRKLTLQNKANMKTFQKAQSFES